MWSPLSLKEWFKKSLADTFARICTYVKVVRQHLRWVKTRFQSKFLIKEPEFENRVRKRLEVVTRSPIRTRSRSRMRRPEEEEGEQPPVLTPNTSTVSQVSTTTSESVILDLTRLEKMIGRLIQSVETISIGMSAMRSAFLQSQVAPDKPISPPNWCSPISVFNNPHQSPPNNSKNPYASPNTHMWLIMMQKLRPEMHIIELWRQLRTSDFRIFIKLLFVLF